MGNVYERRRNFHAFNHVLRNHDTTVASVNALFLRPLPSIRVHVTRVLGTALMLSVAACRVAGQRLEGEISPKVSAGEIASRGIDMTRLTTDVSSVLDRAARDSAFPGAFAVVGTHSGILYARGVGHLDWSPSPVPDDRTMWDLASLTKVIALTSAMEILVHEGKIDLDAPVQRYIPEWTGRWKELVTVRQLLTHSAGMPSWRPLYKEATSATDALRLVIETPLDTMPGVRMVYSDLGAILLGQIVTRVTQTSFDEFVNARVFKPLAMRDTRFRPPAALRSRIAPTEIDPWRQRQLRGEVHDENAFALGGISSHAGLFSTGADLARLARMYLNHGMLDGVRVLDSATIARFTAVQDSKLSFRALGWEKASGGNSGGHLMSSEAFGHTGFTGTSIWIDPANDVFVVLLTNRVNPTRENRKIGDVRIALADTVMRVIRGCTAEGAVLECNRPSR